MDTVDLDSYYPGYDEYCDSAKVPFEDYRNLEDKIEIYEKALKELEEVLTNDEQYKPLEMIKLSKAILGDMKRELWKIY